MSEDINVGGVLEALNNKVDIEFGNVPTNSVGFAKYSTEVTNCITEIPQDIKLELKDGVLTLKAGSKVYVPNGFEADGTTPKFDVVVIESDIQRGSIGATAESLWVVNYGLRENGEKRLVVNMASLSTSVTSVPSDKYGLNYNPNTNLLHSYSNGVQSTEVISFPIGYIIIDSNGTITSIDQVFNGFGYIGSTVYTLPNVKGLIPNGRNEDGSLRNIEFVTGKVTTITAKDTYSANLILNQNSINLPTTTDYVHNKIENINTFVGNKSNACIVGKVAISSSTITSFSPKLPFRAVDYNEASGLGMPSGKYIDLTLGASGSTYTAPANGWFFISKVSTASGQIVSLQNKTIIMQTGTYSSASGQGLKVYLPVKKGTVVAASYTTAGTTEAFRFIYAEGDK